MSEATEKTVRTWAIGVNPETMYEEVITGPSVSNDQYEVRVIEAEPVLDLLERWLDDSPYYADLTPETVALLRANGRRKASESP